MLLDQLQVDSSRVQLKALDILAVCSRKESFRAELMGRSNMARVREMLKRPRWRHDAEAAQVVRSALGIIRDFVLSDIEQASWLVREGYLQPIMKILAKSVGTGPAGSLDTMPVCADQQVLRICELATVILHVACRPALEVLGEVALTRPLSTKLVSVVEALARLVHFGGSDQVRFSALGILAVWSVNGGDSTETSVHL